MRFRRVRIWWLMALVAIVALGCWGMPPWWRWHHEMLERSNRFLEVARSAESFARKSDLSPFDTARPSAREAAGYRHAAAFPWLYDDPFPPVIVIDEDDVLKRGGHVWRRLR